MSQKPAGRVSIGCSVILRASGTDHPDLDPAEWLAAYRDSGGSVKLDRTAVICSNSRKLKEATHMEWIIVIVLIVLLLASVGPRAGYYGTSSPVFDVLSLLILIGLVLFVLDLFGIIEVFGVGA